MPFIHTYIIIHSYMKNNKRKCNKNQIPAISVFFFFDLFYHYYRFLLVNITSLYCKFITVKVGIRTRDDGYYFLLLLLCIALIENEEIVLFRRGVHSIISTSDRIFFLIWESRVFLDHELVQHFLNVCSIKYTVWLVEFFFHH